MDWRYGAEHMWAKHRVTVEQASEAVADGGALLFDPDPASKSGSSARLIGYSPTAAAVLVVILVHREDEPGRWWGANGWWANSRDQRTHRRRIEEMESDE